LFEVIYIFSRALKLLLNFGCVALLYFLYITVRKGHRKQTIAQNSDFWISKN